jgi:transposase-like protein
MECPARRSSRSTIGNLVASGCDYPGIPGSGQARQNLPKPKDAAGTSWARASWIGARAGEHVEVDQAYVGGRTRGIGRGVHHKTLVAAAVEARHREAGTAQDERKDGRYAGRVRLSVAADRSAASLCGFVQRTVTPGSLIVTDDWSGYGGLRTRGHDHHALAEGGDPGVAEAFMPIIHLVFSNLKTRLNGIHHGVSARHLQAYLNEFTFRFNRRFHPFNAFRSLLGIAGSAGAPTCAKLYSGEWTHPTGSGRLR